MVSVSDNLLGSFIVNYNKHNKTIIIYVSSRHNNFIKIEGSEINFMSKQSNQRYRKETRLNHKERAKDAVTNNSAKDMASREGYGDGDPHGFSDNTKKKNNR